MERAIMATYMIQAYETIVHTIEIEADSATEAREKGFEIITSGSPMDYDSQSEGIAKVVVHEGDN
jgi:hypothetical protein